MKMNEYVCAITTQQDLARKLGVSQVSVSRALRNQKGISERLRRRIIEEAEKAGYSVEATNFEARQMRNRACGRRQRTNVICATVTDEDDPFGFGGRLLRGIQRQAQDGGYEVIIVTRINGALPKIVMRRHVDGMARMLGDLEMASGVLSSPIPWVSVLYDVPGVDLVTVDNFASARELGRLLGQAGHRRVAFIGPDTHLAHERLAGLRAGLLEHGCTAPDDLVFMKRFACNYEPARELLTNLFSRRCSPEGSAGFSAIAAYNDFMAELAVRFAREKGLTVPEDLSVTGFDGVLPSRLPETIPLTTAVLPIEEMGAAAVSLLLWRLDNPGAPRRKLVLDAPVRQGASVARLPVHP